MNKRKVVWKRLSQSEVANYVMIGMFDIAKIGIWTAMLWAFVALLKLVINMPVNEIRIVALLVMIGLFMSLPVAMVRITSCFEVVDRK